MKKYSTRKTIEIDGEKISRNALEGRIRKAKKEYIDSRVFEGEVCERCDRKAQDVSHIVSVAICISYGTPKFAYSKHNLELLCRSCHNEMESRTNDERLAILEKVINNLKRRIV